MTLLDTLQVVVLTTARSDYWILRPVLEELQSSPAVSLFLLVSGAHLDGSAYGCLEQIETDGFSVAAEVPIQSSSNDTLSSALTHGNATNEIAKALDRVKPDLLMVLGDRLETHAAACAATCLQIPIAHLHGGELTHGAIDDAFRHGITKMSHLHFASSETHARRIRQMGEPADRVFVSGAPALDRTSIFEPRPRASFGADVGFDDPEKDFLLIAWHPVTLAKDLGMAELNALLECLAQAEALNVLFTGANVDAGGADANDAIAAFCQKTESRVFHQNLGQSRWFEAMHYAQALLGNSSSGILEAASFGLPVVNIGERQGGREAGGNVLQCGSTAPEILQALEQSLSVEFQRTARACVNPYGDGKAAERIRVALESVGETPRDLLQKAFVDA